MWTSSAAAAAVGCKDRKIGGCAQWVLKKCDRRPGCRRWHVGDDSRGRKRDPQHPGRPGEVRHVEPPCVAGPCAVRGFLLDRELGSARPGVTYPACLDPPDGPPRVPAEPLR